MESRRSAAIFAYQSRVVLTQSLDNQIVNVMYRGATAWCD